jgi:transcriptional regulator with XRE-family HTH domain
MSNKEKEMREFISKRFTRIRERLGKTHQQMADELYIVRTTYTRYESGKMIPNLYNLGLLSKKFNISMDWLLVGKGDMFRPENSIQKPKNKEPQTPPAPKTPEEEMEMLEMMKKVPILRHKILLFFQEQKLQLQEDKREKRSIRRGRDAGCPAPPARIRT